MTKAKECREKKTFVFSSSLRIPDPYLLLESPRPLSPQGPPDFLSICLGMYSLTTWPQIIVPVTSRWPSAARASNSSRDTRNPGSWVKSLSLFWWVTALLVGFCPGSVLKNPPAKQEMQVWSLVRKIPRRRKWQPTPVFLPREFHGQRSLEGYSPLGRKESDRTEQSHKV